LQFLDDLGRIRVRRDPRRPLQRRRRLRRLVRAGAGALVLELLLPEYLADGAGHISIGGHPVFPEGAGLPDPEMKILSAKALNKHFDGVAAAEDVSIDVAAGERVGLIGSNGAGKTTFVNMITGYLKPDAGAIELEGADITALGPREIERLGVARSFQIPQLCAELSVLDNMLVASACGGEALSFWQPSHTPAAAARAFALLQRFGLAAHAERRVAELPGGVRKLLDIAM